MIALDQRPPIMNLIRERTGKDAVPDEQVTAVKRVIAETMARHSSAVLVDPLWGYPFVTDALSPRQGLILTLEDHRFEETPAGRKTHVIDGWSVAKIKRLGGDGVTTPTDRTTDQTQIALFWWESSPLMWNAIARTVSASQHLDLWDEARLFALLNVGLADGYIAVFATKYHYRFWRPVTAIQLGDDDGNPATTPEPGWTSLLPSPPYPDYVSGHGCLTSAFAGATRAHLGDAVPLLLHSGTTNSDRRYATLTALERDAFMSRIWSGIHFRDAMDDAYRIGHTTAERVVAELR